jgi:beta-carotene ketolase (CrtW type)
MTRETTINLVLALLILMLWGGLLALGLWLRPMPLLFAPVLIGAMSVAHVGLFIVAHDAMHGALVPAHPRLNRALGRLCLLLYVGFEYDHLLGPHRQHHLAPGTDDDPDFDSAHPASFWPWYVNFLRHYVTWRQPAIVLLVLLGGTALGLAPGRLAMFWLLPCLLASLQLFGFGTFLPHRHGAAFADAHRARGQDWPFWASLLSCFHFGSRHHLHHLRPGLPWWRLWRGGEAVHLVRPTPPAQAAG